MAGWELETRQGLPFSILLFLPSFCTPLLAPRHSLLCSLPSLQGTFPAPPSLEMTLFFLLLFPCSPHRTLQFPAGLGRKPLMTGDAQRVP